MVYDSIFFSHTQGERKKDVCCTYKGGKPQWWRESLILKKKKKYRKRIVCVRDVLNLHTITSSSFLFWVPFSLSYTWATYSVYHLFLYVIFSSIRWWSKAHTVRLFNLIIPSTYFYIFLFGLPIFRYGYGGMRVCVVQTGLTDVHHVHTYVYELPVWGVKIAQRIKGREKKKKRFK